MKKIEDIDPNMRSIARVTQDGVYWRSAVSECFDLRGLYGPYLHQSPPRYSRLPDEVGLNANPGVAELYQNTAGGRIRFRTDSEYVAIRCVWDGIYNANRMPALGVRGFDMYVFDGARDRYYRSFSPPGDTDIEGYESILHFHSRAEREITINFPLYNNVASLKIGLEPEASVSPGRAYKVDKPVVYYGSSITQGGCASRPGNCFTAMISQFLDTDHINLGFSGSAKGETILAEHIASLEMSAFVMDYDNNAPSADWLQASHYRFYKMIRDAQPELPIICVTRPDKPYEDEELPRRREIIRTTVARAMKEGDRHICFVDGGLFFDDDDWDMYTVDSTHPTDLGFFKMAKDLAPVIAGMLGI